MILSDELKLWGYYASISEEGKKWHLEMAAKAEQLEARIKALEANTSASVLRRIEAQLGVDDE